MTSISDIATNYVWVLSFIWCCIAYGSTFRFEHSRYGTYTSPYNTDTTDFTAIRIAWIFTWLAVVPLVPIAFLQLAYSLPPVNEPIGHAMLAISVAGLIASFAGLVHGQMTSSHYPSP